MAGLWDKTSFSQQRIAASDAPLMTLGLFLGRITRVRVVRYWKLKEDPSPPSLCLVAKGNRPDNRALQAHIARLLGHSPGRPLAHAKRCALKQRRGERPPPAWPSQGNPIAATEYEGAYIRCIIANSHVASVRDKIFHQRERLLKHDVTKRFAHAAELQHEK